MTVLNSRRKAEILVVAPEDVGPRLHLRLGEEIVQVDGLVLAPVADNDEEGAGPALDSILDQRPDPVVDLLLDDHFYKSALASVMRTSYSGCWGPGFAAKSWRGEKPDLLANPGVLAQINSTGRR